MSSHRSQSNNGQSEKNSPNQSSKLQFSVINSILSHPGQENLSPAWAKDDWSFGLSSTSANHHPHDLAQFINSPSRLLEIGAFDLNMQNVFSISPTVSYKDMEIEGPVLENISQSKMNTGQSTQSNFPTSRQIEPPPKDSVLPDTSNVSFLPQATHGLIRDPAEQTSKVLDYSVKQTSPQSFINEEACMKLVPIINELSPHNYERFLVDVLRNISGDIPLSEFYGLLQTYPAPISDTKFDGSILNKSEIQGLNICYFILGAFEQAAGSSVTDVIKNSSLKSINFTEFLRTFLAIKILLDSIEIVDSVDSNFFSIPRASIHKAYSLVRERLAVGSLSAPLLSKNNKKLVMGTSQLGRITKIVLPNLKIRRLGRRGSSRYHFLGVTWNTSIIDAELSHILEQENSKPIRQVYDKDKRKGKKKKLAHTKIVRGQREKDNNHSQYFDEPKESFYSYVSVSSKLPDRGCSPRSWEYTPGKVPKPSNWSSKIIARTLESLRSYKVDMEPVIQNFEEDVFTAENSNVILTNFLSRINMLIKTNADGEAFMLFYLTILLLLFPVTLASDAEIPCEKKVQMRKNLASFVSSIRLGIPHLPQNESNHFMNFLHMIRKMIHISEMTSSYVQTTLTKQIVSEIVGDLQRQEVTNFEICETANEEIIFNSVIIASKAYQNAFLGSDSKLNPTESNEMIVNVAGAFAAFASAGTKQLSEIPDSMSTQDLKNNTFDLPYKMFKNSARYFHEICLSDPYVMKLPISVINFILFKMNKEVQDLSFGSFANRKGEVSKETFKTWWVHSSLAEEYMQIFAEVVSLVSKLPETIRGRK